MRVSVSTSGLLALVSVLLVTGGAHAQDPAPPPAAAEPGVKKIGVGGDAMFFLPVGDLADATGPGIGILGRFGYRVIPALEVTGRIGYIFGLSKENGAIKTSISNIPIWAGARYFIMNPAAGLWAGGELGVNLLQFSSEGSVLGASLSSSSSETRFGFNLAAGYVISEDLPIDIRAQFSYLNLLGTESNEKGLFGIGIGAGYTVQF
jgi:hypothetical protein